MEDFVLRHLAAYASQLEQIANAFTANWIPASAGMMLLLAFWSVMLVQHWETPSPANALNTHW